MKVLHVLDRSTPDISGYSSRSRYIVEFQKKSGIEPVVITSPNQVSVKEYEEINGIPYYRTSLPESSFIKKMPYIKELLLIFKLKKEIQKVVNNNCINIIHAHSPILCGLPALLVARKMKLPLVYEVRALWEDAAVDLNRTKESNLRYRITKYLETIILRQANTVVTICEGLKDEIVSRGINKDKVYVVPNGVDTDKFVPQLKDMGISNKLNIEKNLVIGFIGSFYKFEGIECIIKAMPKVLLKIGNAKCIIIGGGKEEKKLFELTNQLNIEKHVIFVGKVPHEEILKYYSIMDILVYPRLNLRITNMVTPLKPLEAMAMGKTVLASDVGGLKELIRDGYSGVLFKSEDIEDLAAKSIMLLMDDKLRKKLGEQARKEMQNNRAWSKIIGKYFSVYDPIVRRKE